MFIRFALSRPVSNLFLRASRPYSSMAKSSSANDSPIRAVVFDLGGVLMPSPIPALRGNFLLTEIQHFL